jgi:hypothetical protein
MGGPADRLRSPRDRRVAHARRPARHPDHLPDSAAQPTADAAVELNMASEECLGVHIFIICAHGSHCLLYSPAAGWMRNGVN